MGDDSTLDLSRDFLDLATQYYAAGRLAVHSNVMPVGANLLHHALEMYLKAHLCETVSAGVLKNDIGHSLSRAWDKFKNQVADSSIDRFDSVIAELNRFEDLRYPDKVSPFAACVIWSSGTPDHVKIHTRDAHLAEYRLNLWSIDQLVEAIIEKSGINIEFCKNTLNSDAISILSRDNPSALWEQSK